MHKFKSLSAVLSAAAVAAGIMVFMSQPAMAAGNIEINSTNFPDANFRNWILVQPYGSDGMITQDEISNIDTINVHDMGIDSLEGINFFTSLKILSCYNNHLTSLDVSGCPELTNLTCDNNDLESLDVSGCAKLFSLACNDNKLEYLDVSTDTALDELICVNNNLKKIFFSVDPDMISVYCDEGVEKIIINQGDVVIGSTNFPDYRFKNFVSSEFDLDSNGLLSSDEISSVKNIFVNYKSIESLKGVEFFTGLEELSCACNVISKLDISKNTKLTTLSCGANALSQLDVSKNVNLTYLVCSTNELTSLNVSNNPKLETLNCAANKITAIDLSKNTKLKDLEVAENELQALNLRNNVLLNKLICKDCGLEKLDVSKNVELESLYCGDNLLSGLNLKNAKKLKNLECQNNQLTALDVSQLSHLGGLECQNNNITVLDLKANKGLSYLDCSHNKISKIDVSNNVILEYFDCQFNNIESIDLSNNVALFFLKCGYNKIQKLDISKNKALGNLDISCNNIKNIDISSNDKIMDAFFKGEKTEDSYDGNKIIRYSYPDPKTMQYSMLVIDVNTKVCTVKPTATPTSKPANNASLTLNKKALTVVCGKTDSLKATLKGATGKITWKSSDKKIATVDANGKITTKQAGAVTITATAAGKSASCEVTVLYKDVTSTKDFWYAPTNYLTAKGVVKGYDKQTKFKPANDCTRAQMVTFLYRLQGEPPVKSTTCKFKDVKKTDYFFKPVIWAVEKGITTGVSKTKFDPQGVCTRAQTVTFLWRMAQKPAPKAKTCKFKDVKEKDYFYKPVIWASEKKIVAGYNDGTFKPQGKCLRRQMVTFLYKYDKFVNGKG